MLTRLRSSPDAYDPAGLPAAGHNAVALREIEPFIRNGEHLQAGKPFEKFGCMRSLERDFFARLCAPAQ
jgi:hypothetical protein